jgi:hypothetical protein
MYGISFKTAEGFVQLSQAEPTLRVLEQGVLKSGDSLNFTRAPGALFVRAVNNGKKIYCNSKRTKISCESGGGGIAYVVVGNASDFVDPGGYGIRIRSSSGMLTFSNKMLFPRVRYGGIVKNLKTAAVTISMEGPYPTSNYYIAIQSLGLDSFQIGKSFITYRNVAFKVATDEKSIQISSFQTQIDSGNYGAKNNFTADIVNYVQILEV